MRCHYCNIDGADLLDYSRISICTECYTNHMIHCTQCGAKKNVYLYDLHKIPRFIICMTCSPNPYIETHKKCWICKELYPRSMPFKRRICGDCYQFKSSAFISSGYNVEHHKICTSCNNVFMIDIDAPQFITCIDCREKSIERARKNKKRKQEDAAIISQ